MKSKMKVVSPNNAMSSLLNKGEKLSKKMTTKKTWKNLDVDRNVKLQLNSINYVKPKPGVQNVINEEKISASAGFKILFAGSVKGKKLAAKLIGKQNSLDVYKINLAKVVSKYGGETEKNLEKLFATATEKNWILFFDEADALFGKRSNVQDAHDKYANQDTSYLLRQLNNYPGLVIFSSKNNNDSDTNYPIHINEVIHFKKPA